MTSEDFSFPATTDTPPWLVDSPRLWRTTATPREHAERPGGLKGKDEEENDSSTPNPAWHLRRQSLSYMETSKEGGEDKMDMLWEDFSEEVSRPSGSGPEYGVSPGRSTVEFGSVQASRQPERGLSGKRQNMVVVIKVLKKLFLLQSSTRLLKRRTQ